LSILSISARQKSFALEIVAATTQFLLNSTLLCNVWQARPEAWGKRFFVVVDKPFFNALPRIRRVEGKEKVKLPGSFTPWTETHLVLATR